MEVDSELALDIHVLTRNNSYYRVIKDLLSVSIPSAQITHSQCFMQVPKLEPETVVLFDIQTMPCPKRYGFILHERNEFWLAVNVNDSTSTVWLEKGFSGQVGQHFEFISKAILSVYQEDIWFPRSVLNKLVSSYQSNEPNYESACENIINYKELTKKERDTCTLMLKGLSNSQIASQQHVSINTVKTHSSNLLRKLNLRSRYELLAQVKRFN
ncbi:response regulator transcription factor [Vibrio splendidus]|jgi:LuxR family transcriptional regulator, positive regulator of biofilm formation|uniref:Helix-turn-helix transcriptional regulator n=1 Tax=Vibrio splendidus TaxID=29497 RepID=A0A2N7PFX3_VIBSP|nr:MULTISPECIES: response regulator transcription factor [Vibrio]MBO7912940.1 response regulator transcription factor [Vibrio sp. G41H]MBT9240752.1 response regulator transcription factor [Vibrio splendidus]MCF7490761.1 response regulator transcription factor [Vibrio sp. G-C-1]MCQ8868936.1 response regulator transcription factor [Vibrio splendidus]MCW4445119.1 response regulator transcription factor [Vibrio splendidus]